MDIDIAKKAIDQAVSYNNAAIPTKVYWHGAEPLLAGIDFYTDICEWTRARYGIDAVQHHIQTNGTLLNEEWFDLFIQEHITTGVSLDGPREIHDANRRMRSGKGTFDLIFENIMLARKKKLFFDVLAVITRATLGHEDDFFDFFYDNRIDFGFEPIVPEDQFMASDLAIEPHEFAEFTIRIFDKWFDQPERRLRLVTPPYHFLMGILQGRNTTCHFSSCCANHYIAISPNGDAHSCIMFARHPNLSFGNIRQQCLADILAASSRKRFLWERASQIPKCQSCKWLEACQGGCPHRAFVRDGNVLQPDMFCEAYKTIFDHVFERACKTLPTLDKQPVPL